MTDTCLNCNSEQRAASEHRLRFRQRDGGEEAVTLRLCEECLIALLESDWIGEASADQPAGTGRVD